VTGGARWTISGITGVDNQWRESPPPVLHRNAREVTVKIQPQQDGSAKVWQDHQLEITKLRVVHIKGHPTITKNRRRAGLGCQKMWLVVGKTFRE